jgi:hypothetical protein
MNSSKQKYEDLQIALASAEKVTGLYLADPGVDRENIERSLLKADWTDAYWDAMYEAAASSAGFRAADAGKDINELIGRVIY